MSRAEPIEYNFELLEEIADHVATGQPMSVKLREISARLGHTLDRRTVNRWRKSHEEAGALFDEARDVGYEEILEDIRHVANTTELGMVEVLAKVKKDPVPGDAPDAQPEYELRVMEVRREDMLGHRKLKIETLFKLLAKWDPRRYGDKAQVELTGKNGGPVESVTATVPIDPMDAARVYSEMMQGKT